MLIIACSVQYIPGKNNAGLCNIFEDDIDLIAGSESELQTITDALEKHRQHTEWKLFMINAKFLSMEKVQHQ